MARHMNSDVEDEIEAHSRKLLAERMAQLTDEQRSRFDTCFPKGVRADQLVTAIGLCNRTIRQNNGAAFPYSVPDASAKLKSS
jgi:hypothetical protein